MAADDFQTAVHLLIGLQHLTGVLKEQCRGLLQRLQTGFRLLLALKQKLLVLRRVAPCVGQTCQQEQAEAQVGNCQRSDQDQQPCHGSPSFPLRRSGARR